MKNLGKRKFFYFEDFKALIVPLLFSFFPIISLFNFNKEILHLKNIFLPVMISTIICIFCYLSFKKIFKEAIKSSIFISLFFVNFYIVGHVGNLYGNIYIEIFNYTITTDNLLIWLFCLLTFILFKFVENLEKYEETIFKILVITSIVCFFTPVMFIGYYYVFNRHISSKNNTFYEFKENDNNGTLFQNRYPDIYYIILDGYGRNDVLKEIYEFDNKDFIQKLERLGFFVGNQSRANYSQTYLSISSSLNMDYLQNMFREKETVGGRSILVNIIDQNAVYKNLKKHGFDIVSISGTWTEENLYYDVNMKKKEVGINRFENMLIKITPLRLFKNFRLNIKRNAILNGFSQLGKIPKITKQTFVYAHFLMPHPPFIFNNKGEPVNPKGLEIETDGDQFLKFYPDLQEYRRKYIDQLEFVNKLVLKTIEKILNESKVQPIIILQSDHGPGSLTRWENPEKTNMKERMSILNAYYIQGGGQEGLYENITPVNSFRMIFNVLFNEKNPILPDKSYFSTWSHPYKFIEIDKEYRIEN